MELRARAQGALAANSATHRPSAHPLRSLPCSARRWRPTLLSSASDGWIPFYGAGCQDAPLQHAACFSIDSQRPRWLECPIGLSGGGGDAHERLRQPARTTFTAGAFSARSRERSFYQGLGGPSLHSALQGGIAYPRGLGPFGPVQEFNGCSPL
jgi:hypothetical protein